MAAIVGVALTRGSLPPGTLDAMVAPMRHRGARLSRWEEVRVVLGQLGEHRARIAAPKSGDGPATGSVVVADLRIDDLSDSADSARRGADWCQRDVVDAIWRRRPDRFARELIGDYSIAIWDPPSRALWCVRDGFGVRSLYYCHVPSLGLFAFATEIKALLALGGVPRALNRLRIAEHLNGLHPDHESTFYTHIHRVPPGHVVRFQDNEVRTFEYWAPSAEHPLELPTDHDYEELFRTTFEEAVRCRLADDDRTASTLSGGLDSSSISAVAGALIADTGRSIDTYSAVFPDLPERFLKKIDERRFQSQVASRPGLEPHQAVFDDPNPLENIDRYIDCQDEPHVPFNLYMHDRMLSMARADGASVLLDGIDGDSVVSYGLGHLTELARSLRLIQLWQEAGAVAKLALRKKTTRLYVIREFALRPLTPVMVRRWVLGRRLRQTAVDPASVLNPELARDLELAERWRAQRLESLQSFVNEREAHAQGLTTPVLPLALELADKCAAYHGLEMRFPFLDRRLVELCVSLPGSQKLKDGRPRSILRRALTSLVPDEVLQRTTKANLEPAFRIGLMRHGPSHLRRLLDGGTDLVDEFIDLKRLERGFRELSESSPPNLPLRLFEGLTTAIWLQSCVVPRDQKANERRGTT